MARQSGRERRGNLDEKRQPYQTIFAPSPDRRKSPLLARLEIAAKRQSAPAGFVVAAAFIGLRGVDAASGCSVEGASGANRVAGGTWGVLCHLGYPQNY
jgi:hypothetical protein